MTRADRRAAFGRSHSMHRLVLGLIIGLVLALAAAPAAAIEQHDRAVPNYDGREDPPPTADEVFIWVPRVIFYPVYLVTEYLIRWPLGKLITWGERTGILGAPGNWGLFPTLLIEFGFRPSIGLYFFVDDVPTENDAFRLHFAWGGPRWWYLTVRQRFRPSDLTADRRRRRNVALNADELSLSFELKQRPDLIFYGLGPDTPDDNLSRYFRQRIGGHVDGELIFGRTGGSGLIFSLGIEDNEFDDGAPESGERSIEERFDVTNPGEVPGYEGYLLGYFSTALDLDSRPWRPEPGSGVRLALFGRLGMDFENTERFFLQCGADAGLFLDMSGRNNTISLRQYVGLVESFGSAAVPFTELEMLGGFRRLRGFREGRYTGATAFVSTLQYTYPIWVFMDGFVFYEVGNVFGEDFKGFSFPELASSYGIGLRTINDRDLMVGMLFGFGMERFSEPGYRLAEVRFAIGAARGF